MNIPSILILIVIMLLFALAVKYSVKNKGCKGDCSKCTQNCSKKGTSD